MASMRARLLLLVAYVASVAVVVRIDRYWNASGYRLSELLRSGSTEAGAALLVFAAVGLVFSAAVVAAGLSNLATRAFFSRPSCGGSCNCQQQRRQKSRHESQNNVDVSVHPTDTTIAAGGPALVAPHYNVSLMHLNESPARPSCPPLQNTYDYQSPQSISQTSPSIKVEPKYFTRN
ncbi:uncharacterized protein LOC144156328 isoform X4 [Haemaphysalis longicornis]